MSLFNDPARILLPMMKVEAFEDQDRQASVDSVILPFDAMAMESKFINIVTDFSAAGVAGFNEFKGSPSPDLDVTFLLDDTTYSNLVAFALPGALVPDSVDKLVKKMITLFHTSHVKKGKIEPYYLTLKTLSMPLADSAGEGFNGRLSEMTIKNEIVNILGERVKAKVVCKFKEALPTTQITNSMSATVKGG